MRGPLIREVGQSFYLMLLVGGAVAAYVGLGLFVTWALA